MLIATAVPPDPARISFLATKILTLESGLSRRPYVLEFVQILSPWAHHYAAMGFTDAHERLRKLKLLGKTSDWGIDFNPKEVARVVHDAIELIPPGSA